jgi:N-acetylmuramoyl-L-alanine amidase
LKSTDCSRTAARLGLVLACFLLSTVVAHAKPQHSSWAEKQFEKAESLRDGLNAQPERSRHDYETVIAAYRRVVLGAPNSPKAEPSAFQLAELTAQMGRQFQDDIALYAAVREYKFLRKEYPGSKHRIQALLEIGKTYQDLGDEEDARPALEELLRRYPRSRWAEQAQSELAGMRSDAQPAEQSGEPPAADLSPEERSVAAEKGNDEAPARSSSESQGLTRVKAVEHSSSADYTRVTIDLEQDIQYDSDRLEHPDRIFFDLKDAKLAPELMGKSLNVEDGRVTKIRIAQYKPGQARIVVETRERANYSASLELSPPRLVIDIHDARPLEQPAACASTAEDGRADSEREAACAGRNGEVRSKVVAAVE